MRCGHSVEEASPGGGAVTELISMPLDAGEAVLIEVEPNADRSREGVVKAGRLADALPQAAGTLEAALEPVVAAARSALAKLREAGPDVVSVEFGVRLGGELGR